MIMLTDPYSGRFGAHQAECARFTLDRPANCGMVILSAHVPNPFWAEVVDKTCYPSTVIRSASLLRRPYFLGSAAPLCAAGPGAAIQAMRPCERRVESGSRGNSTGEDASCAPKQHYPQSYLPGRWSFRAVSRRTWNAVPSALALAGLRRQHLTATSQRAFLSVPPVGHCATTSTCADDGQRRLSADITATRTTGADRPGGPLRLTPSRKGTDEGTA